MPRLPGTRLSAVRAVLPRLGAAPAFGALLAFSAGAQESSTVFREQYKLIKAPEAVVSVGEDLFGDRVNLYTGTLEFIQTDVSLPGNNALPVAVGRRLVVGRHQFEKKSFGRWELDIPHLHGLFANGISSSPQGWTDTNGKGSRCTDFGAPAETRGTNGASVWAPTEFWHGSYLYMPGEGDQQLLRRAPENTASPAPFNLDGVSVTAFPVVTSRKWVLGCLPSLANGSASGRAIGEGFVAVAPDGTKYKFNWLVVYPAKTLTKTTEAPLPLKDGPDLLQDQEPEQRPGPELEALGVVVPPRASVTARLPMNEIWILPTKVIDRFGNTVTYTYDPARPANLRSIQSSDGRLLTISYGTDATGDAGLIKTVSDGTRTWTYSYPTSGIADLSQVTLPDGSRWQFDNMKNLLTDLQYPKEPTYCNEHIAPFMTVLTGAITHPSGATATFTLTPTEHGRSDVQQSCVDRQLETPIYYYTNSLTSKSIRGPGLAGMTWTYAYGPGNGSFSPCNGCVTSTYVDVTDPNGDVTRYTYGNRYFVSEGKLEQIDAGWNGSSALRTTRITYRAAGAGPYPDQDGTSDQLLGDGGTDLKNRPEEARTIRQQGETFSWRATAFDTRVRPTGITRSSTLGLTRSETITYEDNDPKWILGQVRQVRDSNGQVPILNEYDQINGTLRSVSRFGKLQRTMTYNGDGTLLAIRDGRNFETRFSSYKRGIAQYIGYPDGKYARAVVNNIGKPDSITNEAGFTTTFDYDALGRLKSITHPKGDPLNWNPTEISFTQSPTGKYDLDAGHWLQQVKVGDGYAVTYYDALWRPVYTERWDNADPAATNRIVRRKFDFAGRTTFEAYPQRSYSQLGDGLSFRFDVLGRPSEILASSEQGTLHTVYAYNSGLETEITDPRGYRAAYRFQAFDDPLEAALARIAWPEGASLSITRDDYGKPRSVTRSGGGRSVTRSYVYDAHERLCKTIEPESGVTVQDYDGADNVQWRATGLTLTSATSCDTAAADATRARKTTYSYDQRNRLIETTFGDGSPAITRSYTPDGLPSTVTSNGSKWTYDYNRRRLTTSETLEYGGKAYRIGLAYDANGSLAELSYPVDNHKLAYLPNALGEARQVGSYATQISYHPNGAVAAFTYGNGIRRTLQQNTRGLPLRATDAGVLDESYAYDANANVASITDHLQGTATRTMGYDGLNRLTRSSAPALWGDVSYGYDALDNLTATTLTGGPNARSTLHQIDPATNRLDAIVNGPARFNFGYRYDAQGNVTQRGAQTYGFDLANRMTRADGVATYAYDGLGRRTSVVGTDNVNRVQVYDRAGQLLYAGPTSGAGTKYIYLHKHLIAEVK